VWRSTCVDGSRRKSIDGRVTFLTMIAGGQFLILEERFVTACGTVFPTGRRIQSQEDSGMGKRGWHGHFAAGGTGS